MQQNEGPSHLAVQRAEPTTVIVESAYAVRAGGRPPMPGSDLRSHSGQPIPDAAQTWLLGRTVPNVCTIESRNMYTKFRTLTAPIPTISDKNMWLGPPLVVLKLITLDFFTSTPSDQLLLTSSSPTPSHQLLLINSFSSTPSHQRLPIKPFSSSPLIKPFSRFTNPRTINPFPSAPPLAHLIKAGYNLSPSLALFRVWLANR